jgi:hypothetical protein
MNPKDENLQREEDLLRQALRHEDPSPGFAQRVTERASQPDVTSQPSSGVPWHRAFFRPVVRWTAVAAVSASLVVSAVYYRNVQREHAKGEAAKQQLMLALHIASSKLQLAKAKVNDANQVQHHTKSSTSPSRSKS